MSAAADGGAFVAAGAVSLAASWLVVSRVERLGARVGATEALLGVAAALAGDGPEITSAVSALLDRRGAIAAGVSIGSNVFNLAALLGLGAVLTGRVALHRHATSLQGTIAVWIAAACLCAVLGVLTPLQGLVAVAVVLAPFIALLATRGRALRRRQGVLARWEHWMSMAVTEEELELATTVHPAPGRVRDALTGGAALIVVVVASVVMEHAVTGLGDRLGLSDILVGGVILAAVTSLPNAVAAIYWARRGRGAAMLSTALNSNAFNVAAGLLLPAVVLGLGRRTGPEIVTAAWYLGLTVVALVLAYRCSALSRTAGWLIVGLYLAFVAVVA